MTSSMTNHERTHLEVHVSLNHNYIYILTNDEMKKNNLYKNRIFLISQLLFHFQCKTK